jgi:RNA polymerase sigma-70 factor (ECF subfamily)
VFAADSALSAARSRGRVDVTAPPEPPAGRAAPDFHSRQLAEQALLQRVRAHDEAALEALYDRFGGLVFTLALRIVGDRELAQEVVQDAFLRCWRGAERYTEARGSVAAWLMGVARNRAIDLLRSRQHQARLREQAALPPGHDGDAPDHRDDPEAVVLRHLVTDAVAALPTQQRQAIALAYFGGLTQAEIARVTNVPLGTVKSRIRDGMERLRHDLRPLIEADLRPRDGHE